MTERKAFARIYNNLSFAQVSCKYDNTASRRKVGTGRRRAFCQKKKTRGNNTTSLLKLHHRSLSSIRIRQLVRVNIDYLLKSNSYFSCNCSILSLGICSNDILVNEKYYVQLKPTITDIFMVSTCSEINELGS